MVSATAMVSTVSVYTKILSKFPQNITFCFAYGSGVKKQLTSPKQASVAKMIDLIFCVDDANKWHEDNLRMNPSHYSALRYLGHNFISKLQENSGAKVYYNTLVPLDDITIKYGVISTKDLITDLLEWSDLYLAGRLHKPVEIVQKSTNSELETALQLNLQSAVHSALLILPETFTEYEFYYAISNLSYLGDFRMTFGESKNKVENIVKPQLPEFRNLYRPFLKTLSDYVDFPMLNLIEKSSKDVPQLDAAVVNLSSDGEQYCSQDCSPLARLHHLNQLPRWPQKALTRFWNRGTLRQDTEDVLRAIAYDPDCHLIVQQCISDIVWKSSVGQSLKGILTAGVLKSLIEMYQFSDEDTADSDEGVRFKTQNVRKKFDSKEERRRRRSVEKSRHSSRSPKRKEKKEKRKKEKRRKSKRRSSSSDLSLSDDDVKRKEYPLKTTKKEESSRSKHRSSSYSRECSKKSYTHNASTETTKSISQDLKKSETCHKQIKKTPKRISKGENVEECKDEYIGPLLPPNFKSKSSSEAETLQRTENKGKSLESETQSTIEEDTEVAPCKDSDEQEQHKKQYIGPALPPHFKSKSSSDENKQEEQIGPLLPPHLVQKPDNSVAGEIGPSVPSKEDDETTVTVIGPTLPPFMREKLQENTTDDITSNDDDEDVYGPLPVNASIKSDAHIALEERALQIKLGKLNPSENEAPTREEWMIELPDVKAANLGLGPRQFKKRAGADLSDRSSWTDTPQSKKSKQIEQKVDLKKESELNSLRERDVEQEKVIKKLKRKTDKSLLEMHQDKLQEKKKKEGSKEENVRRPFSREIDLKVNRFDEAQKKAIFKKAQLLDDRFSQGQSKFL